MEDLWKIDNRLKFTTRSDYETYELDKGDYINRGKQTYEGIVVERKKGLSLKLDNGGYFDCQGTYWFGSVLDHIKMVSTFDENTDTRIVNSLENLRPLWKSDNCSRKLN